MQHRNKNAGYFIALIGLMLATGHVCPAFAQETDTELPKNSLYLELGGNALIYSLNYDRILGDVVSLRAGIGY